MMLLFDCCLCLISIHGSPDVLASVIRHALMQRDFYFFDDMRLAI